MTVDILDPGDRGDFPYLPRRADGFLDTSRVPVGMVMQKGVLIDQTPSVRLLTGEVVPVTDVVPAPPA